MISDETELGDTHSQDGAEIVTTLKCTEPQTQEVESTPGPIPRKLTEERDIKMAEMQEYYNKKNFSELQHENFYDKLMALKAEQEEHIKLVESVYLKELQNNQSVSKPDVTRRPKSILKQKLSADKVKYREHN